VEGSSTVSPSALIRSTEIHAISAAVQDPEWNYRTIGGIERDTGVAAEKIAHVLRSSPELARETAFTDDTGNPIYARANQPKTILERYEMVRRVLARAF
jgi:hypothetical protein